MAYDKKTVRVLTGGLNLLFAGNQIADDEAQELVNLSTDSFGALRSRRGHTLLYTVGSNPVRITRALGKLWIAAGGAVYADGAVVIGGVSSDRVGLVGFKDYLWAMSTADQRKSKGSNNLRWIPAAPTTAPTILPASVVETQVVDFTGGFTVDPSGDENYSNGGLQINAEEDADGDTVYTADKAVSLNLHDGFSLDDVFRIRVWAKNWRKIDGITFMIDVNDGSFEKDFYTATMKQSDINAGRKEKVTFYLRKRPREIDVQVKDKKRYGSFERIGTTPNKGYQSCVKVRLKVNFNDNTKVRFEEWVMVGNVENTLEGDDFGVYYTYTNTDGHESNPSPKSNLITVNRTGIDVTGMVVSADPQVTGQNVYLTGGTLPDILRVNTSPISGTEYDIRATDDDLTNLNLALEDDHDDPPQAGGLAGPYFGRLVAFEGSRIYWSHVNKPYAFSGPTLITGAHVDVEEGVGDLLAATIRPGQMTLYGTNGAVLQQGDFGDLLSAIHKGALELGIRSANAVMQTMRGDFANLSEGCYFCSVDGAQLVSKKIEPVFTGGFDRTKACVGQWNDVYWVSDGSQTFKWDGLTDRWFEDSRKFSCFYADETGLIGCTPGGQVLSLEQGFTDAGGAFSIAYTSKYYDAGILDNEKTWEDATIWADTGGAALSVVALLNDGSTSVVLGSIASTSKQRFVLQFNGAFGVKARNCAIRITGSVASECVIHEMALNYYVEAREAKSFDSDERDEGTRQVKELHEVYVDLDSPAAVQLIIQSDQPGFEMATRATSSFSVSTSRRGDMFVLSDSVMGHNHRYLLNGADFRLYGLRGLLQVVGTLLHGSRGEYYRSDPISMGTERIKLFKEIHVKYASSATAQVIVQTELPNGSLATVAPVPASLSGTGGVRWRDIQTAKLRLPGTALGRLIHIAINPSADFRLEELWCYAKVVGEQGATGWSWYPFPLQATQPAVWQDIFVQPDQPG